ncbi:hypothetical protein ACJU26_09390 [Acidithiobacillus sp. M4-SHS-6]|uniref:hypothetical protein n=1 Tax=Acidithiobacillus sp. M4-SHS-6 TaxID=3383024 RepID=UPI0039BE8101
MTLPDTFRSLMRDAHPDFYDTRLLPYVPPQQDYCRETRKTLDGSLNLSKIVGTLEPEYAGKSWKEILDAPDCTQRIRDMQENPNAYMDFSAKPMSFFSPDSGITWYVAHNTRDTVITRALYAVTAHGDYLYGVSCEIRIPDYPLSHKLMELTLDGRCPQWLDTRATVRKQDFSWETTLWTHRFQMNGKPLSRADILALPKKKTRLPRRPFWRGLFR